MLILKWSYIFLSTCTCVPVAVREDDGVLGQLARVSPRADDGEVRAQQREHARRLGVRVRVRVRVWG